MSNTLFEDVDHYISNLFVPADPVMDDALEAAKEAGLPQIQVSAALGKYLYLMAKLSNANRILEIGTLAGYSTIWLARALGEGGRLTTLEYDPKHATVATANIERAGLADKVSVRVGAALETLPVLAAEGESAFDMVFIDADKNNYCGYLEWSLRLARPGGLILADNVVREGRVLNADSPDDAIQGIRAFNKALSEDDRVEATIIQLTGDKGHDGLAVAVLRK